MTVEDLRPIGSEAGAWLARGIEACGHRRTGEVLVWPEVLGHPLRLQLLQSLAVRQRV